MWFWQRKKNTRDVILHGIYQENLKTFGYAPSIPRRRVYSGFAKGLVMMMVAAPALLLGNSGIRDYSHHPDDTGVKTVPVYQAGYQAGYQAKDHSTPSIFKSTAPEPSIEVSLMDAMNIPWSELHKANRPTLRNIFGLSVQTIVIDPGHGGIDPGTSGKTGLQEKNITLDIARSLKQRLERQGKYHVVLTRDTDKKMTLKERIAFANDMKADLFISIHVNYLPTKPNNFIETYYYGVSDDAHALDLAQRENAESDVAMHEFTAMVEKLGGTLKLQESKRLASDIQRSLYTHIGQGKNQVLDMGIRKAPFLVIMGTNMPGVLAEVTSLSNAEEEKKLYTQEYRNDIAAYLESGITNYLNRGDYIYEAKR